MWQYGNIPKGWSIERIGDYADVITDYVSNGSFAALAENVRYKEEADYAVLIRLTDYNNGFKGGFVYINQHAYEFLSKSKLYGDEIIISNVGANVGTVFKCPSLDIKMSLAPNAIMLKTKGNDDFYYYWFTSRNGQHALKSIVTGSAQPKFNKTNFRNLLVPVPPVEIQDKITDYLRAIDNKISLNRQINDNLPPHPHIVRIAAVRRRRRMPKPGMCLHINGKAFGRGGNEETAEQFSSLRAA